MKSFRALAIFLIGAFAADLASAGSATWKAAPVSGDWNAPTNWTPNTVPNGPSDVATFGPSTQRAISLSDDVEVNEIVFDPGGSRFAINSISTAVLTISGAGITNNSGMTQQFVVNQNENGDSDGLRFTNSAIAGTNTMLTAMPGVTSDFGTGGAILFEGQSSADHAIIQVFGAKAYAFRRGELTFLDNSTAGDATISTLGIPGGDVGALTFVDASTAGNATINNGGSGFIVGFFYFFNTANAGTSQITNQGTIVFGDSTSLDQATITNVSGSATFAITSTAGSGTIVNQAGSAAGTNGAATHFTNSSTAGSATLIAEAGSNGGGGGLITFDQTSNGGQARLEVFGNGSLDISSRDVPGITIGSLEGDGSVFLGANNLSIGGNGLNTIFSGVIQDGGSAGGTGGQLSKVTSDTLTLSGGNTYTGGTTVTSGTLAVTNTTGSATGSGPVTVSGGILAGNGILVGPVTIGGGSAAAVIAPGGNHVATLTIQDQLTFGVRSTYQCSCQIRGGQARADQVVANGLHIGNGSRFKFATFGPGNLTVGTELIVINNTSADPINGTFSNLPDGGIIVTDSGNLQANYEGGDGNDLTLTVVP